MTTGFRHKAIGMLRWVGAVLVLLLCGTWAASYAASYHGQTGSARPTGTGSPLQYRSYRYSLRDGAAVLQFQPLPLYESQVKLGFQVRRHWVGRIEPRNLVPQFEHYPNQIGWEVTLPVWLLALAAAVPTTMLWRDGRTRPRRKRAGLLVWSGALISLLLAGAWAISLPFSWRYDRSALTPVPANIGGLRAIPVRKTYSVILHAGSLHVMISQSPPSNRGPWTVQRDFRGPEWRPRRVGGFGTTEWVVPLWVPFVVVAAPTAVLWRRRRRHPQSACCQECGYDLTGNVTGTCPECGHRFREEPTSLETGPPPR